MALIGAGRHDVQVIRTGLIDDSDGKTPAVIVEFADVNGDTITAYLYMSGAAWDYTKEKLQTLGWDVDARGWRFEEFNQDPSPIVNANVEIVVDVEPYEGKMQHRVKWINPPGGRINRMSDQDANAFSRRLREKLTGQKSAPGRGPGRKPIVAEDDVAY